jgi:hypothetical protein
LETSPEQARRRERFDALIGWALILHGTFMVVGWVLMLVTSRAGLIAFAAAAMSAAYVPLGIAMWMNRARFATVIRTYALGVLVSALGFAIVSESSLFTALHIVSAGSVLIVSVGSPGALRISAGALFLALCPLVLSIGGIRQLDAPRGPRVAFEIVRTSSDCLPRDFVVSAPLSIRDSFGTSAESYLAFARDPEIPLREAVDRAQAWASGHLALAPDRRIAWGLDPEDPTSALRSYCLRGAAVLTSSDIETATAHDSSTIRVILTRDGASRFALVTREEVGHHLAILLDDHVESAPLVQSEINSQHLVITLGDATGEEAEALAAGLRGELARLE